MEIETLPLQQMPEKDETQDDSINDVPQIVPSHGQNLTGQSLIRHVDETEDNEVTSPYVDRTLVSDAYENPYKETTNSCQTYIRRMPSSDIVPMPFQKFDHVIILSVVAIVFFVFTGVLAFRLARCAKMQHSKGLSGLAQRDSKKSVILSYVSILLGILILILALVLSHTV